MDGQFSSLGRMQIEFYYHSRWSLTLLNDSAGNYSLVEGKINQMVMDPWQSDIFFLSSGKGKLYKLNTTDSSYSSVILSSDFGKLDQIIPFNTSHILVADKTSAKSVIKLISLDNATAEKNCCVRQMIAV